LCVCVCVCCEFAHVCSYMWVHVCIITYNYNHIH